MSIRRWAAGIGLLVILALVAVLFVQMSRSTQPVAADDYRGHPASPTPTTQTASTEVSTATSVAVTDGEASATGDPAPSSSTTTAPLATTPSSAASDPAGEAPLDRPSWNPAAEAPEGADQEPKVPQGLGAVPYRLPDSPERTPALTEVPAASSAEGRLAAGFPEHVVPVPDDVDVRSSSVAPQGQRVLVGLDALSDAAPEAVVDYYIRHCESLAWPVTRSTTDGGDPRVRCGFGEDELTVTAAGPSDGRVDLTVAGSFTVH